MRWFDPRYAEQRRVKRELARARFPTVKRLDTFHFGQADGLLRRQVMALADGAFIRARRNVVVTGPPGAGKTHLAIGLGVSAVQCGYRVRFIKAIDLFEELRLAHVQARSRVYADAWRGTDVVILDGLLNVPPGLAEWLLYEFIDQHHGRGSVVVTTPLDPNSLGGLFDSRVIGRAFVSRLLDQAFIVRCTGPACSPQGWTKNTSKASAGTQEEVRHSPALLVSPHLVPARSSPDLHRLRLPGRWS